MEAEKHKGKLDLDYWLIFETCVFTLIIDLQVHLMYKPGPLAMSPWRLELEQTFCQDLSHLFQISNNLYRACLSDLLIAHMRDNIALPLIN
jgi:hypothetical protein